MKTMQKKVFVSIALLVVLILISVLLFVFTTSGQKTVVVDQKTLKSQKVLPVKQEKKKTPATLDNNKKLSEPTDKTVTPSDPSLKNSFYEVEKHLQPGGEFYLYFSSKKIVSDIHKKLLSFEDNMVDTNKEHKGDGKKDFAQSFKSINAVVDSSGIYDISGGGASIKALTPDISEYRIFLHHYKENSSGRLWRAFGGKSHKLTQLNMLPPNTCFAVCQDFDFEGNWRWINNILNKNSIAGFSKELDKADLKLQKDGVEMKKILACIDGNMGVIVTTALKKIKSDENRDYDKKNVKKEKTERTYSFLLFIKVKDDYIFNLLQSKMTSKKGGKNAIAIRKDVLSQKILQLQNTLFFDRFLIVQANGYLILASNQYIVNAVFNKQKNDSHLIDTDSFKTISRGLPLEGNAFIYMNTRPLKFLKTMPNVTNKYIKLDTAREMLKKEAAKLDTQNYSFFVYSTLDDGILIHGNSNSNMNATFSTLIFLTPAAVLTSAYIPAFAIANKGIKEKKTKTNLAKLGVALHNYSKKHKGYFPKPAGVKGLELLRVTQSLPYSLFISPFSSQKVPEDKNEPMKEQNLSYIYLGGLKSSHPQNIPILFDKPGESSDYFHILLLGGQVLTIDKKFDSCVDVMKFLFKKYRYTKNAKLFLLKNAKLADSRLEEE